jgi:hypothetical protein
LFLNPRGGDCCHAARGHARDAVGVRSSPGDRARSCCRQRPSGP